MSINVQLHDGDPRIARCKIAPGVGGCKAIVSGLSELLIKLELEKTCRVLILDFPTSGLCSDVAPLPEELLSKASGLISGARIPIITLTAGLVSEFEFCIVMSSHLCIATESIQISLPVPLGVWLHSNGFSTALSDRNRESKNQNSVLQKRELNLDDVAKLGLVNRTVSSNEIEALSIEYAEKIIDLAPLAIRAFIDAVNFAASEKLEDGLKAEIDLFSFMFSTRDMKEGTEAFLKKRKPIFDGT